MTPPAKLLQQVRRAETAQERAEAVEAMIAWLGQKEAGTPAAAIAALLEWHGLPPDSSLEELGAAMREHDAEQQRLKRRAWLQALAARVKALSISARAGREDLKRSIQAAQSQEEEADSPGAPATGEEPTRNEPRTGEFVSGEALKAQPL